MVKAVEPRYGSHRENDWGSGRPCLQECKLTIVSKTLSRDRLYHGNS